MEEFLLGSHNIEDEGFWYISSNVLNCMKIGDCVEEYYHEVNGSLGLYWKLNE